MGEFTRMISFVALTALFLYITRLYEKKYKIFTVGYLFLFLVMYVTNTFLACYYDAKTIELCNEVLTYAFWIGDFYNIYVIVDSICFVLIALYLISKKPIKLTNNTRPKPTKRQVTNILIGVGITIVLYLITKNLDFLTPSIIALLYLTFFTKGKYLKSGIAGLFVVAVCGGYNIISMRFQLIICALPILLCFAILPG